MNGPRIMRPDQGPDYEPPETTEMTDLERLGWALWKQWHRDSDIEPEAMEDVWLQDKAEFLLCSSTIIQELMEPSGTTKALMSDEFWENYREVMQHILDES